MSSLASIDQESIERVKILLDSQSQDTAVLLRWMDEVLSVIGDTGYGQVTTFIADKKVKTIKTQKTFNVIQKQIDF